ncbi:putative 1,3-beta-glucan synthase, partial [Rhizoctonia solani 123E]
MSLLPGRANLSRTATTKAHIDHTTSAAAPSRARRATMTLSATTPATISSNIRTHMPKAPDILDPAYNGASYDPFVTPAQSTQSHGHYKDSDMEHGYERRDTFQSEASNHDLVHIDPRYYNQQYYDPYASRRDTDTESELEHPYLVQPYKTSNDSLINQQRPAPSEVSTPTFNDYAPGAPCEPYPAWGADRQIPLSKEEIEDIFLDLTQKFGFQCDSMRNQ